MLREESRSAAPWVNWSAEGTPCAETYTIDLPVLWTGRSHMARERPDRRTSPDMSATVWTSGPRQIGRSGRTDRTHPFRGVRVRSCPMPKNGVEPVDELNRYLEIIRSESDRGAVLVAHALLETSLQELVNATFVERRHNKALFKHPGPLSSAYSLEMVGVSLGLLSEQEQKDLETVRLVRNKFAHSMTWASKTRA